MKRLLFCGLLLLSACTALPARSDPNAGTLNIDPMIAPARTADPILAPLLSAHDPASARFLSVGQLQSTVGIGWLCTATLVASAANPPPQAPALLLTAGHCGKGLTGNNEVVIDQPMGEGWFFVPSYFHDNIDQHRRVPVVQIRYSSMKTTDIAVLQLSASYGEMLSYGFKPVLLKAIDTDRPSIEIAHIPFGLFANRYMRYSACETRALAAVFETGSTVRPNGPWFWPATIPNDCIGIYSGSSGAPVFMKDDNTVSAVLSTGLTAEDSGCGDGRPCEIVNGQPVDRPGTAYVGSVARLIPAFKPDGTFDSSQIDQGTGIAIDHVGDWNTPPGMRTTEQPRQPALWNMRINESHELIRFKTGIADQVRCADAKDYGPPQSVSSQPLLELPMPEAAGIYAVCAIGRRAGSEQWQPVSQATTKLRQIQ